MPRLPLPATLLAAIALSVAGCKDDEGCPSGQTECNGVCREAAFFQGDAGNCGACGVVCGAGTCVAGACVCDASATTCPPGNPRCIDTATDPLNCGGCGVACAEQKLGSGCAVGACTCLAPADDDCGTFCTSTLTDPRNCGGCGIDCPLANDVCVDGACRCPDALPDACPPTSPTACVNLDVDRSNCGTCGRACTKTGEICGAGACACPPGLPDTCGNACVSTAADALNCGACGRACPRGATCTSSACACPEATPVACGSAPGTCCAGTGCCAGGACQTEHSNGVGIPGLGQPFFDCVPLGTYDLVQAARAATAWQVSATAVTSANGLLCQGCFGWQTGNACGVWCYGTGPTDPLRGRASLNTLSAVCVCPAAGAPNWN